MNNLGQTISHFWDRIQVGLFPFLEEQLGPLTEKHKQLVTILELVRIEEFVRRSNAWMGRPLTDRCSIARAFIAKAFYNLTTTRNLLDRLQCDKNLRRICGWSLGYKIPSESTFSRAFAEFATTNLAARAHEALIISAYQGGIVGQVSDDATAIEAREEAQARHCHAPILSAQDHNPGKKQTRRGRPKKDTHKPEKDKTRIQKQMDRFMTRRLLFHWKHLSVSVFRSYMF